MAIIPNGKRFIGISENVDLVEKKSSQINRDTEPYTMQDISDTVAAGITTGVDWGDIVGTLSDQTDLQSELDDKQDELVSGTNIKTINSTSILGSGDIETASVNSSETFIPLNDNDEFIDSPIYALKQAGVDGYSVLGTKVNGVPVFPFGGISASSDFGLEITSLDLSGDSSVSLGDYAQQYYFGNLGQFYWYSGSPLTADSSGGSPSFLMSGVSGVNFSTAGYNLFESTVGYFKLDAKNGSPSRVDGLLHNIPSGLMGFGNGLDINSRNATSSAIYWDEFSGEFRIQGLGASNILFSNALISQTYMSESISRLGLEAQAIYVSNDLVITSSPSVSTKVLNVRDASGNSYSIKLYNP